MARAVRRLDDGRWHFQHGPIDCIVGADGDAGGDRAARRARRGALRRLLDELVAELPLLRTDLGSAAGASVQPRGPIARRMVAACRPHAAAAASSRRWRRSPAAWREELIAFFDDPRIVRAWVNNGGDIALHLGAGAAFRSAGSPIPTLRCADGSMPPGSVATPVVRPLTRGARPIERRAARRSTARFRITADAACAASRPAAGAAAASRSASPTA